MRRVMMITPNFENNSLGRTWCLWLLARHLGWHVEIHGVKGHHIWTPLAESEMAADCHVPEPGRSRDEVMAELRDVATRADLLVAVKPLPPSYGVALELSEVTGTPVLLDIDDPDIEVRTTWKPRWERAARWLARPEYRGLRRLARRIPRAHGITVSNPVLRDLHGGLIIPHVRRTTASRQESTGRAPVVRFVGSVRGHKGVAVLRESVAAVAHLGVRLEVTDDPPEDAAPWETWLGITDMDRGRELVAGADIIAVPSENHTWSRAQLPAKLLDAMAAGRAVVASDLPPIRWATGDTALHVPPGSVAELAGALEELCDPRLRESLGNAAHRRAAEEFSPEVLAPRWGELCEKIIRQNRS